MSSPSLISTFISGDPVRIDADVATAADLVSTLGLGPPAGVIDIAPGAALVLVPTVPGGAASLRWVQLAREVSLRAGTPAVAVALVLLTPTPAGPEVIRFVGRLRACLASPALIAAGRQASTREDLIRLLVTAEHNGGDGTLDHQDVLALLGSTMAGLPTEEAAHRLHLRGPNRLGDTGEIPVVRVPRQTAAEDDEAPLYPPRHWSP